MAGATHQEKPKVCYRRSNCVPRIFLAVVASRYSGRIHPESTAGATVFPPLADERRKNAGRSYKRIRDP